jgi:hypothetical protein
MSHTLLFDFLPQSFTKEAWENRPFKRPYALNDLFTILKEREKQLGFGKYLRGYIYFKEGFFSEYNDGTIRTKPKPYQKWWETDSEKCHKGCCSLPPPNWDPITRTYEVEDSFKGALDNSGKWRWCICQKGKYPDDSFIDKPCPGHPRSEPIPFRSLWIPPPIIKRDYQEFKRINGSCGLEEQIKNIKNIHTISHFIIFGLGTFRLNI